jgi:hypothetical protein
MVLARYLTARETGERLDLTHIEVIRRIRKGDIKAQKFGWNWVVTEGEIDRVKNADWYKRLMLRRSA